MGRSNEERGTHKWKAQSRGMGEKRGIRWYRRLGGHKQMVWMLWRREISHYRNYGFNCRSLDSVIRL
jgi:hypothetical protein